MLPLFLGRTSFANSNLLGVVIVNLMPGVFGVFGRGDTGLDDIDKDDLVLKIGNRGDFECLSFALGSFCICAICPCSSVATSCLTCTFLVNLDRNAARKPKHISAIIVMPAASRPGSDISAAFDTRDESFSLPRLLAV